MYCAKCGTDNTVVGGQFCHQCGAPLNGTAQTPTVSASIVPAKGAPTSLGWLFWLGASLVLLSFTMRFLPGFAGVKLAGQFLLGQVFWTGVLFCHLWKKRGRNGWMGFGVGALVAIAAVAVTGFVAGAISAP